MRNGACGGREKTLLSLCTWVCYTFWEHECTTRCYSSVDVGVSALAG